jgi:Lipase (class 3)
MESPDTLDPAQAAQAVKLGLFVNVAYQMRSDNPGVAAPPPPSDLPDGYSFVAWVQMRDFLFASGELVFYGLIARSPDGADSILAIRGTASPEEWVDDLTSLVPAPWTGPGQVGYGFNRIYQTLRVVPFEPSAVAAAPAARPSAPALPFAQQVATIVRQAAPPSRPPGKMAAPRQEGRANPIRVAGHSLGSALATLYVAENLKVGQLAVELICTFASPKVGDHEFAASFAEWRQILADRQRARHCPLSAAGRLRACGQAPRL